MSGRGPAGGMPSPKSAHPRRRRWGRRVAGILAALLVVWLLAAYGIAPQIWRDRERMHLNGTPRRTVTSEGIPGDPLNVGLVGPRDRLMSVMAAAGWRPADPVTLRSSVDIVASVGLHRPDSTAPVSPLYLYGRSQDLAFEKPVGGSARRRHHVRLWAVPARPGAPANVWTGSASFDRGVGLSRYTRQVTHHIAPAVDAERDTLMANLATAGALADIYIVPGMGPTLNARNGGGDWFYTDGEMMVGVLRAAGDTQTGQPVRHPPPVHVRLKNAAWGPARLLLP